MEENKHKKRVVKKTRNKKRIFMEIDITKDFIQTILWRILFRLKNSKKPLILKNGSGE